MFTAKVVRRQRVNLAKVAAGLKGPTKVKVGLPSGEADQDNINKAIWNEFGTKGHEVADDGLGYGWGNIPERPFLRNSMRNNRSAYMQAMKVSAAKILRGETSIRIVLAKLGIKAQGDIQSEITSLSDPPNSPYTIAQKGSSNPLIDTGEMRAAVTWKVEE